jgi:hypothetical protein
VNSTTKQSRWHSYHIAWLFLVALFAVASLAVYTFIAYRSAAVELLIERDRQLTYLSAARIRSEMTKFSDALQTFARTQALYDRDLAVRQQALQESLLVREGVFDGGLILLDNHGRVVATEPVRGDLIAQDWSDRDYFRRLLGSAAPIFSNAETDGPDGSQVIVVSVPVFGERSQFVGALLGMLRLGESTLSPFYAAIVRLRIGQSGSTYVVDGNGNILFDSGSRAIGLPYATYALPGLVFESQGGAVRTQDADQNEIVAAYAPIPGTLWTLVIEDDWATLTRDTRRYRDLLTLLLTMGLLLPIVGVALLLKQRRAEFEAHESAYHGTRVAQVIKGSLMPKHPPVMPGWRMAIHHETGTAVSGDFHDMLLLPDGRLVMTVGHITAGGVTAAILLATARATLRGTARCLMSPAEALSRSNEFLCPETPDEVSIICFYALLDPSSGKLQYANAGHELAFYRTAEDTAELPALPFRLGEQLDVVFDQDEITIGRGEYLLFCQRELVEATNPEGELFGVERLKEIIRQHPKADEALIEAIRTAARKFAGSDWDEEHELTLITMERLAPAAAEAESAVVTGARASA